MNLALVIAILINAAAVGVLAWRVMLIGDMLHSYSSLMMAPLERPEPKYENPMMRDYDGIPRAAIMETDRARAERDGIDLDEDAAIR